jgi:LPXTG-motif cell wall-anchored protein
VTSDVFVEGSPGQFTITARPVVEKPSSPAGGGSTSTAWIVGLGILVLLVVIGAAVFFLRRRVRP